MFHIVHYLNLSFTPLIINILGPIPLTYEVEAVTTISK